jgi:hypothetical protein
MLTVRSTDGGEFAATAGGFIAADAAAICGLVNDL